jgi:hypothetical protein
MKLTPHFELWEFEVSQTAARRGLDNKIPPNLMPNAIRLAEFLEHVRILVDAPIINSSVYRSPLVNKAVKGDKKSQHMQALAADFNVPGYTVKEVCEILSKSRLQYDQLINEFGAWIHISIPEKGKQPRRMYFNIV